MAGHSKWANTRHRKAAQDAKRGKIFTKIIRELVTAAKLGGGRRRSGCQPARRRRSGCQPASARGCR
ncbi:hypothetical protein LTSEGIV_1710 [Salmonella enterica subsp. enterica serovar Give str. S5-487]|nr:hypothetical protein LTSEGIV_1710 [Salmonella enterica subsp. enterica serovar Give str. S5-487]